MSTVNVSCNHLAQIVMTNPMLYGALWNKGRNSVAIANIFRKSVVFDADGIPFLTLPLINDTQVNSFAATLTKNNIEHTPGNKQITIAISWAFGTGLHERMSIK